MPGLINLQQGSRKTPWWVGLFVMEGRARVAAEGVGRWDVGGRCFLPRVFGKLIALRLAAGERLGEHPFR